jgi:hypothetical protein
MWLFIVLLTIFLVPVLIQMIQIECKHRFTPKPGTPASIVAPLHKIAPSWSQVAQTRPLMYQEADVDIVSVRPHHRIMDLSLWVDFDIRGEGVHPIVEFDVLCNVDDSYISLLTQPIVVTSADTPRRKLDVTSYLNPSNVLFCRDSIIIVQKRNIVSQEGSVSTPSIICMGFVQDP